MKFKSALEAYIAVGYNPAEAQRMAGKSAIREFEEQMLLLEATFPKIMSKLSLKGIAQKARAERGYDIGDL